MFLWIIKYYFGNINTGDLATCNTIPKPQQSKVLTQLTEAADDWQTSSFQILLSTKILSANT